MVGAAHRSRGSGRLDVDERRQSKHEGPEQAQRNPQVHLYNYDDCSTLDSLIQGVTVTNGGVAFNVCGAVPGRTYIVSVKYNVRTIVGAFDPGQTCDYTFKTLRNGVVVDEIDNALHLAKTGSK